WLKGQIAANETRIQALTGEIEDRNAYYIGRCGGDVLTGRRYRGNKAEETEGSTGATESPKVLDDGLGTYGDQGGHHPMSKKAFEGVKGYDPDTAVTISDKKLSEFGVRHWDITGQQHSLYSEFAKTGKRLTLDAMKEIEIKAFINSGVPKDYAINAVEKAVADLIKHGVTGPVRIPWN
ncbi:MAG: hypothetical protein HFH93_11530, partial [Lachnospiraceae bacterium]|nr:hypothetical protein [Lachnospiraceae bacterium]